MGGVLDIINGNVNEALEKTNDLSEERMNICRNCPLYKETPMGPICNPNLYINETDKESVSASPKVGYRRGCGCQIARRSALPTSKCIVSK